MYKCKQCDKIYETPQKLGGHMIKMIKCGSHLKPSNSSIKIKSEWKIYNGKYKCPNCGSEFSKKGICSHIWRNHTEEGRLHRYGRKKGSIAWNKGLTKETDIRVKKTGEIYSKRIKDGIISASFKGKKHKKETIDKLKLNAGGLRRGAGRGKSGWYKGYWCDSTWELAWVIYNLENGIKFKRNKKGFKYLYKSKKHKFYPDFILENGTYIEIKGYLDNKNIEKLKQFKLKIEIIGKIEIKKYLDYVKQKYNDNYVNLYDKITETVNNS